VEGAIVNIRKEHYPEVNKIVQPLASADARPIASKSDEVQARNRRRFGLGLPTFFRDLKTETQSIPIHLLCSSGEGDHIFKHGTRTCDREKAQIFRGADTGTFIMDSRLCAEQWLCAHDAGAGYGYTVVDGK
jgi:hypothetical protein